MRRKAMWFLTSENGGDKLADNSEIEHLARHFENVWTGRFLLSDHKVASK